MVPHLRLTRDLLTEEIQHNYVARNMFLTVSGMFGVVTIILFATSNPSKAWWISVPSIFLFLGLALHCEWVRRRLVRERAQA